jgi:hypothetical protein
MVNIRPSLDILFRLLKYKPTKMAAGIIGVPGSEAINTIGKNNISSIHLSHWQPNHNRTNIHRRSFYVEKADTHTAAMRHLRL